MSMVARTLVDNVYSVANKGTRGGKLTWSPTTNRVMLWNWLERDAGQDAGVIVRMTDQDMMRVFAT